MRRHIQNLYKALPSPPAAFLSVAPCGESDALYGSSADDCSLRQRWRLSTPDGHGKTAKPSSVAVNIQVQALPGGQVGVGCLPAGINRQRQPGRVPTADGHGKVSGQGGSYTSAGAIQPTCVQPSPMHAVAGLALHGALHTAHNVPSMRLMRSHAFTCRAERGALTLWRAAV